MYSLQERVSDDTGLIQMAMSLKNLRSLNLEGTKLREYEIGK